MELRLFRRAEHGPRRGMVARCSAKLPKSMADHGGRNTDNMLSKGSDRLFLGSGTEEEMTTTSQANTSGLSKHPGSCHCGRVRFEVELDLTQGASRCNCSICMKLGVTGAIVKPDAFKLLSSKEATAEYVWGGRVSQRHYCKECGVHCFAYGHLDVLGGDYVSVNVNCLDDVDVAELQIGYWDGRHNNWGAGMRETPWPVFEAGAE